MGSVTASVTLYAPDGSRSEAVEAEVDTAATYTVLPRDLLSRLGIEPTAVREFELGDGQVVSMPIGDLRMRLNGEVQPNLVVFAPEGRKPLIGVTTLETFSLMVDPVGQRLVPVRARW